MDNPLDAQPRLYEVLGWRLEPRDGGKNTFATYTLSTDPGGSIPT
ncbi:MAG: hypothetical protein ACT4TC_22895 [Myxococcaceae bacterium]